MEVALLNTFPPPIYQRIARKALHLQELGLSDAAIARRLGVTDKTVAKGIHWLKSVRRTSATDQGRPGKRSL